MRLTILTTAIVVASVSARDLIPPPAGPFRVHWESHELVDHNRQDPFNSSHARRIMVSKFTPVPTEHCKKVCRVPYMPALNAEYESIVQQGELTAPDIQAKYPGVAWPSGVFANLDLELCCESHHSCSHKRFPKLIFDIGLNNSRLSYSSTAQHIAALGYEVFVMDHPYETDIVVFPNGDIIYGGRIPEPATPSINDPNLEFGLAARSADAKFLMDTFGIKKTVFIGHSYGGATALNTMFLDSRIVAGVNLDGALIGDAVTEGVSNPFLLFGATGHNSSAGNFDPSWGDFIAAMDSKHPKVWKRELSVNGTVHQSYTDMALIGDVTGLRANADLRAIFFGEPTGKRMAEILSKYLGAFLKFTLDGRSEEILAKPSSEFPEVEFLT